MRVIVLGLGNILLSDEGVGVRVVETLQRRHRFPAEVELIDGGTSAMDLMDTLASCDHLIVVDAVKTGAPVGTVVRLAGEEVPAFFRMRISPHQLGLSEVLATLMLLEEAPGSVTVIGVVPQSLETSLDLTPLIQERVPVLCDMVLAELAGHGLRPE